MTKERITELGEKLMVREAWESRRTRIICGLGQLIILGRQLERC